MKFAIALFDPLPLPAARAALQRSRAGRRAIVRLFFYQDGVHSASANVVSGDEFDPCPPPGASWSSATAWNAVVCIAAALRRGVLNAEEAERYGRPGANRRTAFMLSGLGQLHEAAQTATAWSASGRPMSQSLLIISRQSPWSGRAPARRWT